MATVALLVPPLSFLLLDWFRPSPPDFVTSEVAICELPLTVSASGKFEPSVSTKITCDVWNLGQREGTQIQYLVPNGAEVREGDLLVQLDASIVQERLEQLQLNLIQYTARQQRADARLQSQRITRQTKLAQARQSRELAEMALQAYEEGTAKLQRQLLESQLSDSHQRVVLAKRNLGIQERALAGTRSLHEAGYRSRLHVQRAALELQRAQQELQSAQNELRDRSTQLEKFDQFELPAARMKLESDLLSANLQLQQVKFDNKFRITELLAQKSERDQALLRQLERIEDYTNQVENCQVRAPHDGTVVYASDRRGNSVREGASVYWRQTILTLPSMAAMQAKLHVTQSEYRYLEPGMPVTVQAVAYPESSYRGEIESVASVSAPTNYTKPEVSEFEVTVNIEEVTDHLRPGMTALVNIEVQTPQPVLSVPVEAIVDQEDELCAYVETADGPERRAVVIGDSNDEMVEVCDGLKLGERVILPPLPSLDSEN